MTATKEYWFAAKAYGWGWGLPLTWQGWVVLGAYTLAIIATGFVLNPATKPVWFAVVVALLSLALVAVCWMTGEPARWR